MRLRLFPFVNRIGMYFHGFTCVDSNFRRPTPSTRYFLVGSSLVDFHTALDDDFDGHLEGQHRPGFERRDADAELAVMDHRNWPVLQ